MSEEERRANAERMREITSPENMARFRKVADTIDITRLLPQVEVPCLICHCIDDRMQPVEQGRLYAAGLPNARLIAYASANHIVPDNDPVWPQMKRDIRSFLSRHV